MLGEVEVTVRPYRPEDLGEVLDAWEAASRVAHTFLDDDFLATERRTIADQWLPAAETWVAEVEGRVVGFVALIGNEVGAIFVQPGQHGRGVGRTLMDTARDLREYLELEVFEANPIGRRFYDRYGFVEVGRGVHEASDQPNLRLRLDPTPAA